jgi:Icc-related predicted phosphoesterase
MRIAAVADVHMGPSGCGLEKSDFAAVNSHADVLVIAGDLTNLGTVDEMKWCLEILSDVKIPIVTVLGNHDFESNKEVELAEMVRARGIHLLDGTCFELDGVGFAGTKGFGGGFGRYQLAEFGEDCIKSFVKQSEKEAEKLRHSLSQLTTKKRIVVTHYAPIRATVEGEPEPIYPFLGSSHLEMILDEVRPDLALHGHAHKGCFEGYTSAGVRVCNVALSILRSRGEADPFIVFDL